MAKKKFRSISLWPRFSRYTLHQGRIVPDKGAEIEWFDPWQDHLQAETNRMQPPYLPLVAFSRRLSSELRRIGWPDENVDRLEVGTFVEILDWCSQYGLLGLFHQTVVQINDPCRDRIWIWSGGRWKKSSPWPMENGRRHFGFSTSLISETDLRLMPADKLLARFLGREFSGPTKAPDSEAFFRCYGEPIGEWVQALTSLAEAISQRDLETLNIVAGRAARVRVVGRNRLDSKVVFPSLLSAFAERYLQDLQEGRHLRFCTSCAHDFVTSRKWSKYCSRRCAARMRQQRFVRNNPAYYKKGTGPRKGEPKTEFGRD
jgi:hypothetical protein